MENPDIVLTENVPKTITLSSNQIDSNTITVIYLSSKKRNGNSRVLRFL